MSSFSGIPGRPVRLLSIGFALLAAFWAADVPEANAQSRSVELSHVGDTTQSKKSLGGSGHAVAFERTAETGTVTGIRIFAARYGYPQPPKEDFHVYLLDENQKVIKDFPLPYSTIKRTGQMRWYNLPVKPTEVPERFYVALSFNPGRTKGVYLGLDETAAKSHSFAGLPGRGFQPFTGGDWMVRVRLVPGGSAESPATATARATVPSGTRIGPEIEHEFRAGVSELNSFVDLDRGKIVPVPPELQTAGDREAWMAWSRKSGVDVRFRVQGGKCLFGYIEVCLVPYSKAEWAALTLVRLRSHHRLTQGELGTGNLIRGPSELPATFLFRTREGGLGALEVVGSGDDFESVKVRYKRME